MTANELQLSTEIFRAEALRDVLQTDHGRVARQVKDGRPDRPALGTDDVSKYCLELPHK